MEVKIDTSSLKGMLAQDGVRNMLFVEANKIAARVQVPRRAQHKIAVTTRVGKGRSGAFSQVVMRGQGALAIEFGSRNNAPIAPLRKALR